MYGVGNFCKSCHLCRKRYKTGPKLLWNTNRKLYVADRFVSVPMTLSDLERRGVRGQSCLARSYGLIFDLE